MARLTNGPLGQLSGKVGGVVVCKWKDVEYIRSLPKIKKNRKPSPAQLAARARFNFLNTWLKSFAPLVSLGFKDYSGRMTGMQAAFSCNSKAVKGVYPDFELDFPSIMISYGDLPGASGAKVIAANDCILEFSWDTKSQAKANDDDQVMLLAYIPEKKNAFWICSGANRYKGNETLKVNFQGTTAETYMAFISNDRKKISNSQYLGQVTVL
ncbi:DUF6266 family protein [Pedobacter sp. P351]|uniref:DUF6266 family protein n=1 Tax=Pedobacter superstes TaxID=3133441 RepID=UPI0030B0CC41